MTVQIIVPPLGESVKDAIVSSITKKVGDSIKMDELLIELETDKVTLEINAPASGSISELSIKAGDTVIVGQTIGAIAEGAVSDTKPQVTQIQTQPSTQSPSSIELAPSVRRIVTENNINPSEICGTGKDGRITKVDALNHQSQPQCTNVASASIREDKIVKMSKLRQTVAKRLKESQNTAAILTTFNEVDMSTVMKLRKEYQDVFVEKHGIKLGFMSFFLKAAIIALQEIPAVNAEIKNDNIIYHNYCDIGVAVGTDTGLVVPVIRNAEQLSIAGLEKSISDYGKKAKDGKITLDDLKGGTFTISNGGVYGSLLSTPIINPPQSGILGMHKIQDRPVVINGEIAIRPMMYIALSYDHRIIDGKEAVTFLIRIKELIEDPRRLVLDV